MCADGSPELEAWLGQLYAPEAVPDDDLNASTLEWLRHHFDAHGAVSTESAWDAMLGYRVALAEAAVVEVLHDLHRVTSLRPSVTVDPWMESSVRISIDDGYTTPSMWALEKPEALAEVASYFQEQLDQSGAGAWPTCHEHNVGLHAEVWDGTAVWRCRLGQHRVAAIGALGA